MRTLAGVIGCWVFVGVGFAVDGSMALAQAKTAVDTGKSAELPLSLDKRFMDTTAEPCVNFAQYSCGNFAKLYPIPADKSGYGSFYMIYDHAQDALHSLLEKDEAVRLSRTPNERRIGDFYASCKNESAIDATGLKPVQRELDRIAAIKSKSELTPLLAHDQLINVNSFFGYGEQQDFKDARKQIAVVDQGGLGLPERDYYLRTGAAADKTRAQYVQHITNMLKLLGEPEATAAADAGKIMQMETALANASMDVTSRRDPKKVYHIMTVQQLAELAPDVSWASFFEETGASAITDLNVGNPDFFKGLNALIESTDLETIKAYLRWQLINGIPSYALPKALDSENFDFFSRDLRGQQEQRARWKRCAQATDGAMGEAVGEVYV